MSTLLLVLESAVDAADGLAAVASDLDVLEGMAQDAPAAVAHGHVALHLDDGLLLDELEGVGPVLALGVRGVGLGDHVLGLGRVDAGVAARGGGGGGGEGADAAGGADASGAGDSGRAPGGGSAQGRYEAGGGHGWLAGLGSGARANASKAMEATPAEDDTTPTQRTPLQNDLSVARSLARFRSNRGGMYSFLAGKFCCKSARSILRSTPSSQSASSSSKMAPLLRRRRIALCLKASALAVAGGSAASPCVVSAFGTCPVPIGGSKCLLSVSSASSSSSVSPPRHSSPRSRSSSSRGTMIHHPSQRRTAKLLASTEEDLASSSSSTTTTSSTTTSTTSPLSQASLVEGSSGNNVDRTTIALGGLQEKLFLGIEPTPEILAIMTIYFVEGALGLARLAQTFLLKDTLHLGPAEMAALTGLFTLPW